MKDAKGHGSNARGGDSTTRTQGGLQMFGRQPTRSERAQLGQMTQAFSAFAGKMNAGGKVEDAHAAAVLAAGHPKSDSVPVHSGMHVNPPDVVARFARQRQAAKGFASGRREINRLKRQGK